MNETVLITGASSGIGRAVARSFAQRGARLFVVARREQRLRQVVEEGRLSGSPEAYYSVQDLAAPGAGSRIVEQCLERLGDLDILICNAGYGILGPLQETKPEQMERIWRVNFQSSFESIHKALPHFLEKDSGHIVLISSILGKKGMPYWAAYCSTKFALAGLGEALWGELWGTGVNISIICPGYTATEFPQACHITSGSFYKGQVKGQTPHEVAKAVVEAIDRKYREVHLSGAGKFLMALNRIAPAVATRLTARIGRVTWKRG